MTLARKADRVYRSAYDTVRARAFRHTSGKGWDFDLFRKDAAIDGYYVHTYTSTGNSPFATLRDLCRYLRDRWGLPPVQINPATVTEGW